jgi:hypothetical protein
MVNDTSHLERTLVPILYNLLSFHRSAQDYKIYGYGNYHIFRTQEVRPTQSVQQSHGSVQFFEVAVQYKLFCIIKYRKQNKVLVINYYDRSILIKLK